MSIKLVMTLLKERPSRQLAFFSLTLCLYKVYFKMAEAQVMSSLCKIFHLQDDGNQSVFGCGCLVNCSDSVKKIATSWKIRSLTEGKVFAKFGATQDREIQLQTNAEGENPEPKDSGIAYLALDDPEQLPEGKDKAAKLVEVDEVVCRVPVWENFEQFSGKSEITLYNVVKDQGKCILQRELGSNKRVFQSLNDINRKHLLVLGSPILNEANQFLGIVDSKKIDNEDLLELIYHGNPLNRSSDSIHHLLMPGNQKTPPIEETDSGTNKLSPGDPLTSLWKYSDFRDVFSQVLDVKYSNIKYWPHLAEKFDIDKIIHDAFSDSDIVSPSETMLEYMETKRPKLNIKEFCKALAEADANEVCRIVQKSVEAGDLSDQDRVAEMCDKVPSVLDQITLKLDREDRLWEGLAIKLNIPKEKYSTFKRDRTQNPTRDLFDVLRTQGPDLNVENLRRKLDELSLNDVLEILIDAKIEDEVPLTDLAKNPNVMFNIECTLNKHKEDSVYRLAKLYEKENLIRGINIELTFKRRGDIHSPTVEMMEYIIASHKKEITIEDLIIKLGEINRKDCTIYIVPYLKGGKQDIDKVLQGIRKGLTETSSGQNHPEEKDENPIVVTELSNDSPYVFTQTNSNACK